MLFNSIHFLFFFPIVIFLYYLINPKFRWVLLLFSSYYFYMSWRPKYALLLVFTTLVGYFGGLLINYCRENSNKKKIILIVAILLNLVVLFIFKYFNFFFNSLAGLLSIFSFNLSIPILDVILPLGISFHTFQIIAYLVDVYRRKIDPEKHLGIFTVFVVFFPQLVAGPIERAGNILPQFRQKFDFNYQRVADGLKLMVWGFFKKVVVADGLAFFVERVYGSGQVYSGPPWIIATILFSFQIYCDFSGYSDIAVGAAQVMGFKLTYNFLAPYGAKSIAEFWRRWHISLSSWFQDYVFNPLYFYIARFRSIGKINSIKLKHFISFAVTMLIGEALLGLWHGANWTFVLFGLYHGVFIILYYLTRKVWDRWPVIVQVCLTFIITTVGWIFFRANSLSDVIYIFSHLFKSSQFGYLNDIRGMFLHYEYEFIILLVPLITVILTHRFEKERGGLIKFVNSKSRFFRWSVYYLMVMMIFLFGTFGSKEFIYFNF